MRRLILTSAIAAVGISGALAGCGGSDAPPPATVQSTGSVAAGTQGSTTSANAASQVSAAFATLRGAPYTSRTTTSQEIDASGLPDDLASRLRAAVEQRGSDMTTTTRFESPERVAITQAISGRTQRIVLYDGSVYVSADGSAWARLTGEAATAFSQASSLARIDPAELFTGITPDGSADVLGRPATRYSADVDVDQASELVGTVIGGLGDMGTVLKDLVTIEGGTALIAVDDARGAVSQLEVTMDVALDLGGIAAAAGRDDAEIGPVGIESRSTETVTSYGDVTVEKPRASTTISTITGLGEFLSGG